MMHFRRALSQLRQRLDAQPRPAIEDMTPEERWERVKEIIDTAIARKKAGWPIPPRTPAQIAADEENFRIFKQRALDLWNLVQSRKKGLEHQAQQASSQA
jgi:hypothetical protein